MECSLQFLSFGASNLFSYSWRCENPKLKYRIYMFTNIAKEGIEIIKDRDHHAKYLTFVETFDCFLSNVKTY